MEKLTDLFKVLSDETRLRILCLLTKKDYCVCELTDILSLSQPKISKHLTKLKDLGFVETRREAQFIFYKLNISHQVHQDIMDILISYIHQNPTLYKDAQRSASCTLLINK